MLILIHLLFQISSANWSICNCNVVSNNNSFTIIIPAYHSLSPPSVIQYMTIIIKSIIFIVNKSLMTDGINEGGNHWIELNWIELNWIELNWIELNWIELNWIGNSYSQIFNFPFSNKRIRFLFNIIRKRLLKGNYELIMGIKLSQFFLIQNYYIDRI